MSESEITKSTSWDELTFANNFLFCKILESEPDLCRRILEILLRIKIERLEVPQSERTMQESPESKTVRFDVYVKDETRVFDIEMQTTVKKNLPKRARYYQSVIDMDSLSHGENYARLKDSYVIFLCLSDPLKRGLPVYCFENTCRDESGNEIKLNDGAFKLFFNAAKYANMESDEEKSFFKFLASQTAESELTKSIEEKVAFAKKNMRWRKQYMTWEQTIEEEKDIAFEEGIEQGIEQGIERGEVKKALESAENLLKESISPEIIARCTGLTLEKVLELAENLSVSRV